MRFIRATLFLLCIAFAKTGHAQGIMLPGVSPVNLGMGGAATAAPIDSIGSIYWNSATTSALKNEMAFSVIDAMPDVRISSSIAGLGGGSSEGGSGGSLLPGFALIHRREDSPWTFGLAGLSIAGSRVNYASSLTNPVFTPQSNAPATPGGLGAVNATAIYTQFILSMSYAVSENFSIGFGPTVTAADVVASPMVLGPLDDSDGSGQPRFSNANGHAVFWGGGFQVGMYHIGPTGWNFGAAFKSKQWMEEAIWNTTDELGRPTLARWHGDLPTIVSVGTSYAGMQDVVLALDIKYFDYSNARGLGDSGFGADGRVLGVSQDSVLAISMGTQIRLTEQIYSRFGYTFNQRPQQDGDVNAAVFGPFFYQHTLHAGGSYQLGENVHLNASYSLVLPSSLTGPIVTPAGVVPGSSLEVDLLVHVASVGATVKY